MIIAISKGIGDWKYERYGPWLTAGDMPPELVELSLLDDAEAEAVLRNVGGIVFTGGTDIHPARYGMPNVIGRCETIDVSRDERECTWFAVALERKIPILGICRGMQLANVALGGTLIPHIPTADAHRREGGDAEHTLRIDPTSLLARADSEATVNSSHHQALNRVAPDLRVIAQAPDGVVEAVEWRSPDDRAFFLGVQWHPERMPPDATLSSAVRELFLTASR